MGAISANLDYKGDADSDPSQEPLLGKRHPSEQNDQEEVTSISITQPEVDSSIFTFNAGWRSYQDTTFTALFIFTMVVTYGFGIFATMHANVHGFVGARNAYYHPSSHQCNLPDPAVVGDTPLHSGGKSHETLNLALLSGPMLGTLISCFPLGVLMLWLLHRYTKVLVYIMLPFAFLLPFAINIAWFSYCQSSAERCTTMSYSTQVSLFIVITVMCVLSALVLYSKRARIELTIQILNTAAHALKQNMSLMVVLPVLAVGVILVNGPVGTFIFYASLNGKVVPDEEMINDPSRLCGVDGSCCSFKQAGWVPAYLTLAGFASLWALMVTVQLQLFTISGTIAQWYFAPAGSSTVGTTMQSLRNAFGPSFGTVCFSGLIVAIMRMLRSAANSAGSSQRQGIISILIRACLLWILNFVEFLTSFTSNFAAITGDSFCASANMTYKLLQRNFLSTIVVDVLATRLLLCIVLGFSMICSLVVYGIMDIFTSTIDKVSAGIAVVCFFVAMTVFLVFMQVLCTVVDTVYICYAMDKDTGVVSKSEVHDVYVLLPASAGEATRLAVRQSEP